jgi:alanine transaminase
MIPNLLISSTRQVISLLEYPDLLSHPLTPQIYPVDTIERAKKLYAEIGSVGAYTHSKGVKEIRERVARFIERESDFDEMRVGSVGRSVG